jgi:crotonobetainyl-CoA:carnitine CoA-transferase CaiB-like acyl-CoA transferase
MSLQESGIIFSTESIMNFQIRDEIMTPVANESSRWAPQGVYSTVGEDCWIAIVCQTDADWVNLCNVIFEDDLSALYISKFADVSLRRESHVEINLLISAWTSQFNHNEATKLLQVGGVSAGPVLQNWEIVSDPHLFERDYFVDIVHPDVGHFRWDGFPWKFSLTKPHIRRPAPLFGEHTVEVSREIAGLSHDEINSLKASGVIQDRLDVIS